jgi:hypothetical protein
LQTIGWEHAEPVLRSLAFGLLDQQGDGKAEPSGPYRFNVEQAAKFRDGWSVGNPDARATTALLATLRDATPESASQAVSDLIAREVAPGSIWDAVMLSASELLMRDPGISRSTR